MNCRYLLTLYAYLTKYKETLGMFGNFNNDYIG